MNVLHLLPRFRRAYRELKRLEEVEQCSRTELAEIQLSRLNSVWEHAIHHVPYYRSLIEKYRIGKQFSSLEEFQEQVPLLPREEVQKHNADFLSERPDRGWWCVTSGSTGTSTRVHWGKESHLAMLRAKYRYYQMWDIDIFDPAIFLWSHASETKRGWRGAVARLGRKAHDWLRRRIRFIPNQVSTPRLQQCLQRMARFRPRWMYAYSSIAKMLAQVAIEQQFRCDSLQWICLSAEPSTSEMLQFLQKTFSVQVGVEYGATECGVLAGLWPDQTMRIRDDQVILETVPTENNQFAIAVTVLTNPSFPLIRYLLGDTTTQPIIHPVRGFSILPGLIGRDHDYLVNSDGELIHGFFLDDLFEGKSEILCWQAYQHATGLVQVRLQARKSPGSSMIRSMFDELSRAMVEYPVDVQIVDQMPRTAAGKHRRITSELYRSSKQRKGQPVLS